MTDPLLGRNHLAEKCTGSALADYGFGALPKYGSMAAREQCTPTHTHTHKHTHTQAHTHTHTHTQAHTL